MLLRVPSIFSISDQMFSTVDYWGEWSLKKSVSIDICPEGYWWAGDCVVDWCHRSTATFAEEVWVNLQLCCRTVRASSYSKTV